MFQTPKKKFFLGDAITGGIWRLTPVLTAHMKTHYSREYGNTVKF